jgi:hypothetical protein
MTRFLLLLPFLCLAGCTDLIADIPEPRNPAFKEDGEYRSLHTVPDRPKVNIPLGQRIQLEQELQQNNADAYQMQRDAGFEPMLPDEKPAIPPEVE